MRPGRCSQDPDHSHTIAVIVLAVRCPVDAPGRGGIILLDIRPLGCQNTGVGNYSIKSDHRKGVRQPARDGKVPLRCAQPGNGRSREPRSHHRPRAGAWVTCLMPTSENVPTRRPASVTTPPFA